MYDPTITPGRRQGRDLGTKSLMTAPRRESFSVAVDSGAEANVLPENMMQWIPLNPSAASMSGKIFRGAVAGPILAKKERMSATG